MSGLCGWIGARGRLDGPDEALAAMSAGLAVGDVAFDRRAAEQQAGLALTTSSRTGAWHERNDIVAAVDGYPDWSDDALAALAARDGHGAALAEAFRRYGNDLLERLHGEFAIAVVDRSRDRALAAIDRLGIRPMCYAAQNGLLVFGSTTDSVRAHPAVSGTIAPQAIFDFLFFIDRIPAPGTIYRELNKLPPGHCVAFEAGAATVRRYWSMRYAANGATSFDGLSGELRERMDGAVGRAVAGEDLSRTGAFLSGGLDSSTITGLLSRRANGHGRSFTIGFRDPRFDESGYAALAAEHFGTTHDCSVVEPPEVLDVVAEISRVYDEPFANSSAIPAYLCARRAKAAGVELLLAGDGGDELFAGNSRYLSDGRFDHYAMVPAALRRMILEPAARLIPDDCGFGLLRKAGKYVRMASLPVSARITRDNLFASLEPEQVFGGDALAAIDPAAPLRLAEEIYRSGETDSKLQKFLHFDLRVTLADSDLRKVRQMCEIAGIRTRFPFLDEQVVAFSGRIPPDMLMRGGELRGFYKHAFRDFLPAEILAKKKHGFGLPYLEFVRGYAPLRDFACDSLRALAGRGYFRESLLDTMVSHIGRGEPPPFQDVTWDLIVLEQWLESRR